MPDFQDENIDPDQAGSDSDGLGSTEDREERSPENDPEKTVAASARTVNDQPERTLAEPNSGKSGQGDQANAAASSAEGATSDGTIQETGNAGETDSVDPLTFMPPTYRGEKVDGTVEATQQSRLDDRTQIDGKPETKEYPTSIGRYQTVNVLGEGAFGIVLKCIDTQLDREVAIKLAKFHAVGSELAIQRFMGEARSAAQLRHPNIVPVFEYGKYQTHHFIAYQFVEGKTLQQLFKKGLPLREAIQLMIPVCRGLDYAHEQGIIHRDIKPANILIDKSGVPHIADFGCAREEKSDETRTVDGSLLGTPAYMSPESAAGKANQADARSDIWSLGVMLYELSAKRRPFKGGIAKILADIQTQEPPKIRSIDKSIPVDLETIVTKCLQKEPRDRFRTGGELADELQRWLDNRPIQSRRVSLVQRTWMWSRRNPKWAAMWGALAAVLLIGLMLTSFFLIQIRNKQQRLVQSHLDSLLTASPASVPVIIDDLKTLDRTVTGNLQQKLENENLTRSQEIRIRLAIQLLNDDSQPFDSDAEKMLSLNPAEMEMVVRVLRQKEVTFLDRFWAIAIASSDDHAESLRAACCLAQFDSQSENWKRISLRLIGDLLDASPGDLAVWLRLLDPVAEQLKPDLVAIHDTATQAETRIKAAQMLAALFVDEHSFLIDLCRKANPEQLHELARPLIDHGQDGKPYLAQQIEQARSAWDPMEPTTTERLANLLILSAMMDEQDPFFEALKIREDPTLRTELIHRAPRAGLQVSVVRQQLDRKHWANESILIACLQMLGEYGEQTVYLTRRNQIKDQLLAIFKEHPKVGVHSSAQWLLSRWNFVNELQAAKKQVQTPLPKKGHNWHEDPSGICFAVFGPIDSFQMGQPGNRDSDFVAGYFHHRKIPRRFGISTTEITAGHYVEIERTLRSEIEKQLENATGEEDKIVWQKRLDQFDRNAKLHAEFESSDQPVLNVSWIEAAMFCALLNRKYRQAEEQGYQLGFTSRRGSITIDDSKDMLANTGFRLPTSGEYEYSARAGAKTRYHIGQSYLRLGHYAWTAENSGGKAQPVASLKPNYFGMFDIHGNAKEWCHDPGVSFPTDVESWIDGDVANNKDTFPEIREIRDHYFASEPKSIAVYLRERRTQQTILKWIGFRIAQTYPDDEQ